MSLPEHKDLSYYWCANCRREIKFGAVEFMGQAEAGAFTLMHTCDCSIQLFERRFEVDHGAIRRLLGNLRPHLPYRAAPGESLVLHRDKERLVTIFAWECEQLQGVDEFLLFAGRPRER